MYSTASFTLRIDCILSHYYLDEKDCCKKEGGLLQPRKGNKERAKVCVKCGRVLPLNTFYPHKEWASQSFHDAWCKECAAAFCKDADTLREYCWYNNRTYSNQQYDAALKKAMYALANQAEYLKAAGSPAKRAKIEAQAACRSFFSLMNLPNYYIYVNNVTTGGDSVIEYPGRKEDAEQEAIADDSPLLYDRVWNGMYTQREIDYLNGYYGQLEEDFVLDNENIRDYARKVSKASLDADLTYNKMRHGQVSVSAWKEAQAIFDNLSKSANFAACRRKPGENAGLGSLGLIIQKIEGTGVLQNTKVTFPKDDVDRIIEDFRHTIAAVGLDVIN